MGFLENCKYFFKGVKGVFKQSFLRSVSEVTKSASIASTEMLDRIDLWLNMYSGNAPWLAKNPQSLGLPAIIASEIARMVTLEAEINISGSPMAELIDREFKPVRKNLRSSR